MIDIVALGELLIDFAAKSTDAAGYPTMAANPGGAPGNFLAALNAYGRKTAFLGKVGNDAFGHLLLGTLNRAGIETMEFGWTMMFSKFWVPANPMGKSKTPCRSWSSCWSNIRMPTC